MGDELKDLVLKRTGLKEHELECPREKSELTPCVCRDGDCAMTEDFHCVGCGASVPNLIATEITLSKWSSIDKDQTWLVNVVKIHEDWLELKASSREDAEKLAAAQPGVNQVIQILSYNEALKLSESA